MKTKEELKKLFENGDIPVQEEFWEWLESYWHKDEKISENAIDSVEKVISVITDGVLTGQSLSISIPKSVKRIESDAFRYFYGNHKIIEVNFNEGLEEIGAYAFRTQSIKRIKTPSTLKVIENYAFGGQESITNESDLLHEIILNEGLVRIEDSAFNCSRATVKHLYIPDSVQYIGGSAFAIPSIETVSAPSGLDLSQSEIPASATITYR